jgi:HEAT repeat protein/cyclophilin family peptidyl-prolyl cis-trans isomerase
MKRIAVGFLTLTMILGAACVKKHESPEDTIARLEYQRSLEEGKLVAYLNDGNPTLRERAALALARIQDPATVPALAKALSDEEASVRRMAAFALGQSGSASAERHLILRLYTEQDPAVVGALIDALGKIGEEDASKVLTKSLDSPDSDSRARAATALGLLGRREIMDEAADLALIDHVEEFEDEVRWRVFYALARRKPEAALDVLIAGLGDRHPLARAYAARGLGQLEQERAIFPLMGALADKDWRVVVNATRALGKLGDQRAVEPLLLVAKSPNEHLSLVAIRALGQLGGPRAAEHLRSGLESESWRKTSECARALATADTCMATPYLIPLVKSPTARVRAASAEGLGTAGDSLALATLEGLLADEKEPLVLTAAVSALALNERANLEPLRTILSHTEDLAVAATLAAALGERQDTESVQGLVALYRKFTGDEDVSPHVEILEALGEIGSPEPVAFIQEALDDPRKQVVEKAAWALEQITGEDYSNRVPVNSTFTGEPDFRHARRISGSSVRLDTEKGEILIKLLVEEAPLTAANFARLVEEGYFDGLTFHRVVSDFVIQDGCPRGDGWGGPGYRIPCEYNEIKYERGLVGMALAGKDTGGSQFFITHSPQPHLDGRYTIFGRVLNGMETVDRMQVGDRILGAELVR